MAKFDAGYLVLARSGKIRKSHTGRDGGLWSEMVKFGKVKFHRKTRIRSVA